MHLRTPMLRGINLPLRGLALPFEGTPTNLAKNKTVCQICRHLLFDKRVADSITPFHRVFVTRQLISIAGVR
jgi:hypothetical protein